MTSSQKMEAETIGNTQNEEETKALLKSLPYILA